MVGLWFSLPQGHLQKTHTTESSVPVKRNMASRYCLSIFGLTLGIGVGAGFRVLVRFWGVATEREYNSSEALVSASQAAISVKSSGDAGGSTPRLSATQI